MKSGDKVSFKADDGFLMYGEVIGIFPNGKVEIAVNPYLTWTVEKSQIISVNDKDVLESRVCCCGAESIGSTRHMPYCEAKE